MRKHTLFFPLIFLLGLLISCSQENPTQPTPVIPCDLACEVAKSPFPDVEVEAMAIYLSGHIVAPESVYNECLSALTGLRAQFPMSDTTAPWLCYCEPCENHWLNSVEIKYVHPTRLGGLAVWFNNDSLGQLVFNGNYHSWDSLNNLYRLDSLNTDTLMGQFIIANLFFHGLLESKILAEDYKELPGVIFTDASLGYIGDISNLYPGRDSNGKICFLADIGLGYDNQSGCTVHKYVYFKQESGEFILIGSYLWPDSPEPSWWSEARALKQNWENYK